MSTAAFGTRRVRASLIAIGKYLDEGVKIATGVSPAHVIRLETDGATRVTDVDPDVIKFTKGTARDFDLSVVGSNLLKAKAFKLVRGTTHELHASSLVNPSPAGFTARFLNQLDPAPGLYDALVTDDQGLVYALDDACRIKLRNGKPGSAGTTKASSRGAKTGHPPASSTP
jgi:hypothetical protein